MNAFVVPRRQTRSAPTRSALTDATRRRPGSLGPAPRRAVLDQGAHLDRGAPADLRARAAQGQRRHARRRGRRGACATRAASSSARRTRPSRGYYGGTDNHLFGATHNAWRQGLTAGAAPAGGAAAAVAAGLGPLAEGSDGAGSVRIPASLNGVVGLKPSIGRIPADRARRAATTPGPSTARSPARVADAGLMMDVVAGPDTRGPDLTLPDSSGGFHAATERDVSGLRIARSPDLGFAQCPRPRGGRHLRRDAVRWRSRSSAARSTEADPGWGDPEAGHVGGHLAARLRLRVADGRRLGEPGAARSTTT